MRFADVILRQGHLSEEGLIEVVLTGDRPLHLDQCERCAARAVDCARWLDDIRRQAVGEADGAFPAERLAAQQAQIFRRLEQLDEPARVIVFPSTGVPSRSFGTRRVAPAWVGIAAAAGLVIGVVGGQMSARLGVETATPAAAPSTTNAAVVRDTAGADLALDYASSGSRVGTELLEEGQWERFIPGPLQTLENATRRLVPASYVAGSPR